MIQFVSSKFSAGFQGCHFIIITNEGWKWTCCIPRYCTLVLLYSTQRCETTYSTVLYSTLNM